MNTPLKVEFRIGEIEFKAEGDPSDVEKQRESFVNTLLPLAVDAMVQTRGTIVGKQQFIETNNMKALPSVVTSAEYTIPVNSESLSEARSVTGNVDFSRESLNTYINKLGNLNDQDFVVLATYFAETKNGQIISITSETVKQYYDEARRTKYSNLSQLLTELVKKGLLKDDDSAEKKIPKSYVLTNDGLKFARDFVPKPNSDVKPKVTKTKKAISKIESVYSNLNADNLNLKNYPEINSSMDFREQMMLVMYIVSCEGHGDAFSTADMQCLMTSKLGLSATIDQINGVFKRNKKWFANTKDEGNKKAVKHKLLMGAKEFAQEIIAKKS